MVACIEESFEVQRVARAGREGHSRQTYATLSSGAIGSSTRGISTQFTWRGGEVVEVRDAEQANASITGTTFTRPAADQLRVVRQGTPASTTTYGFVAATDTFGRVASVWRRAWYGLSALIPVVVRGPR